MMLTGEQLEMLAEFALQYEDARSAERSALELKNAVKDRITEIFKGSGQDSAEVAGFKISLDSEYRESIPVALARQMLPEDLFMQIAQGKVGLRLTVKRLKEVQP
jgi:hypothetical protein